MKPGSGGVKRQKSKRQIGTFRLLDISTFQSTRMANESKPGDVVERKPMMSRSSPSYRILNV